MDVTCERCGTEYEFDETLLSGRGTSVKCTNCGQVFKVYPKSQDDADRSTSTWRLRLQDGSVDEIDSLRELQRRISSGELKPENEISRGAEGWKPLGAIPELETFFLAVGIQIASPRIPSPLPPLPSAQPAGRGAEGVQSASGATPEAAHPTWCVARPAGAARWIGVCASASLRARIELGVCARVGLRARGGRSGSGREALRIAVCKRSRPRPRRPSGDALSAFATRYRGRRI